MSAGCEYCKAILRWNDLVTTAIAFGIGNFVLLALYLIPLTDLLVFWLPPLIILAGGAFKTFVTMVRGDVFDHQSMGVSISTDVAALCAETVNRFLAKILPIVFWVNFQETLVVLAIMYVVSVILGFTGIFIIFFLAWNGAFAFGKFEKEIMVVARPHLEKAHIVIKNIIAKVPRHAEAAKKASQESKSQ